MAPAIASTVVDRPTTQVFAYATEPTRFREGSRVSSTVTWTRPAPRRWARRA